MKIRNIAIGLGSVMAACTTVPHHDTVDYSLSVNPFIGTDYTGNTYPGAQAPFGMVQLSPDNGLPGWDRISGYFYPDSTIAGFSHTHLSGTGAGDLYDISFMPVTLPYRDAGGVLGIHSRFSHADEEATAGYYKVYLSDYDITAELTATERCGIQQYTYPTSEGVVILNLAKAMNWDATKKYALNLIDSCTIEGYRFSDGWARDQKVFFRTRFSSPISAVDTLKAGVWQFDFNLPEDRKLLVITALSGVSTDGASANMASEASGDNFTEYLTRSKDVWNTALGQIDVKGGTDDQRTVFYTALYHSMLAPTIYSDINGMYYGPDKATHTTDGWTNYSTFSLWDTYRAAQPLFTITHPDKVNDMVKSFLAFYDQNGRLPVWNMWGSETDMMIGYHSVPVIVEAYMKGIGDFDPEKALEACVATANIDSYRALGQYKTLGYVPYDGEGMSGDDWSMSMTLEYAYDDYCIAEMAKALGHEDIAKEFYKRSQNYRNVFNPAMGHMQPKDKNGVFQPNFNPEEYSAHICESNAWQYLFAVQQDINGLMELMGGKSDFVSKLDSLFTLAPSADIELPLFSTGMIGQYAHGNEPSHHVIYLYNIARQPWKAQDYSRKVMSDFYANNPAGLCGNEDCGQMSAWYVFSALGFYPVNPVDRKYEIGSPLFEEATIKLPDGNAFTVKAPGTSEVNRYVKGVKYNGQPYTESYITHDMITSGGILELEMTSEPGNIWY